MKKKKLTSGEKAMNWISLSNNFKKAKTQWFREMDTVLKEDLMADANSMVKKQCSFVRFYIQKCNNTVV